MGYRIMYMLSLFDYKFIIYLLTNFAFIHKPVPASPPWPVHMCGMTHSNKL